MEVGKLNAQFRGETGKPAVRRLRAAGKIPAICYGQAQAPLTLSVDPTELHQIARSGRRRPTPS
jgi:large subunit ribosomal protein L25